MKSIQLLGSSCFIKMSDIELTNFRIDQGGYFTANIEDQLIKEKINAVNSELDFYIKRIKELGRDYFELKVQE